MKISQQLFEQIVRWFGENYPTDKKSAFNHTLRQMAREKVELGENQTMRENILHSIFSQIDFYFPVDGGPFLKVTVDDIKSGRIHVDPAAAKAFKASAAKYIKNLQRRVTR